MEIKDSFKDALVISLGNMSNEEEIASNLFSTLRTMDKENVDIIYSIAFDKGKYKDAMMNRLLKAANNQIIHL